MFVRTFTLVLAIAASAIALPGSTSTTVSASQCDTGSQQCCDQTLNSTSSTQELLSLLGILNPVEGLVGLDCSPITVIGTGSGATCVQQPVCCTNVSENGLINLGCSPLDLNA